ncbi:MAG TPA: ABC transporter permease subunit, partial [Pyrinomonadaceae bacterium]|nr:ABC transporter permease subunit [Pyrinomonadaceae bacterium]
MIPKRLPPWVSQRTVALAIVAVLFVGLCILPGLYMLGVSFTSPVGSFSLENYRHLLNLRQRQLLLSSTLLSTATALLATLIGAPLGLLLGRADLPAKRLLRLTLVIPVVIPPYILGLAWIYTGGSAGLIAQVLGRDLFSSWTYSLAGAVIVLSIGFYPLSMLATEAASRRVEAHLEEAALLVARAPRVLWRITLPLIAPSIAAAALIIFVLALSEFGVPGLLRVPVFTTEVFTAFAAYYDFGSATSLAVPLLGIALIAAVAAKLVIGTHVLTVRRSTHTGLPLALGGWRPLAIAAVGFVLCSSVVLPVVILAREVGQMERVTAAISASASAIGNSLVLATIAATIIVILAAVLGYGRARVRTRLRGLLDLIFVVVFAVPSTVVGMGLIGLWN